MHKFMGAQGYSVTGSQVHRFTGSQGHGISGLQVQGLMGYVLAILEARSNFFDLESSVEVVLTLQILLGSFMLTTLRNDICEGYESYESYEGYEGHESYESYEI